MFLFLPPGDYRASWNFTQTEPVAGGHVGNGYCCQMEATNIRYPFPTNISILQNKTPYMCR